MVETRSQKRKRGQADVPEWIPPELSAKDDCTILSSPVLREKCKKCNEPLICGIRGQLMEDSCTELSKKIRWEYDIEDDGVILIRNTLVTQSPDPNYSTQEWCLNCNHNWVINESSLNVISMD